jgi:hypothetical protein
MGYIANKPEAMTCLDHLGTEWGESPVRDGVTSIAIRTCLVFVLAT